MINFIFSPVRSFFSLKLYQEASQNSIGKGLLYLCYLAFLFGFGASLFFGRIIIPRADAFMDWLNSSLPAITLTAKGATASVEQPFTLTHPQWGTVLMVDTTKDEADPEQVKKTVCYLTRTQLHVWIRAAGHYRVIDILPQLDPGRSNWQDVTLTGPLALTVYKRGIPFAVVFVLMFGFIFLFLWKLLAGLFYSLVAMLMNAFRKPRLPYDKLLNISLYALTPVTLLQWLIALTPFLPFRMNSFLSILITAVFLAFAIFGTQVGREKATA